jgi:hypothetical protein
LLKETDPALFEMYSPYDTSAALNREEYRFTDADFWLNYTQLKGPHYEKYLETTMEIKYDRYGNDLGFSDSSTSSCNSSAEEEQSNESEDELPDKLTSRLNNSYYFLIKSALRNS